jgi:hypothetical protein
MAEGLNGSAEGPSIPASAETLVRFQIGTPMGQPEREGVPVQLLAGNSERLMRAYRAGLTARGIHNPSDDELLAALAFALENAHANGMDEATYERFRTTIDRYVALPDLKKDERTTFERLALQGAINCLFDVCGRGGNDEEGRPNGDPYLQKLQGLRQNHFAESLKVGCAVALRGWEGREGTCEVIGDEASAASLAKIPDAEQQAIGLHWLTRAGLTLAQKKTSDSSPPSPTTLTTTPEAGSTTPSGKASSRSRGTKRGTKSSQSTPVG